MSDALRKGRFEILDMIRGLELGFFFLYVFFSSSFCDDLQCLLFFFVCTGYGMDGTVIGISHGAHWNPCNQTFSLVRTFIFWDSYT